MVSEHRMQPCNRHPHSNPSVFWVKKKEVPKNAQNGLKTFTKDFFTSNRANIGREVTIDNKLKNSLYAFAHPNLESATIIVVTHNLELAEKTDRMIKLRDGQIEN